MNIHLRDWHSQIVYQRIMWAKGRGGELWEKSLKFWVERLVKASR